MGKGYTTEDFSADTPAEEYIERFRDEERFLAMCRECPNFGKSWVCPPLEFDSTGVLGQYGKVHLMVTKIIPEDRNQSIDISGGFMREERIRLERELLEKEALYGGRAFAYSGMCIYCKDSDCERKYGRPCCHPDKVRPSLEAFGFDLERTLLEIFGFRMLWSRDGKLPEYLVLISGIFYN